MTKYDKTKLTNQPTKKKKKTPKQNQKTHCCQGLLEEDICVDIWLYPDEYLGTAAADTVI